MIDFNKAIELIRRNGGFKPNKHESSYYRVYRASGSKPMQVRVSSHGTHLWTWYDKDYDPSYSINTCVVYSEDGTHDSNVAVDMRKTNEQGVVIGEKKMFEIIQYVYNCQLLDDNDAALINQAILSTWQTKSFKDPFAGTPKHAKVFKLKPNEPIETLVENKERNENIKMNKKQTIRLNESDFHRLVKECVKRVLGESNIKDSAKMKCGDGFIQVSVDRNEGTASWIYMGNDGEPYSYGSMDIEEYVDNTWLPYEETHRPSRWIPKRIEEPVLRLFAKTGMRDEAF